MTKVAIFVGPTGRGLEDELGKLDKTRFSLFPPIQRLDLPELDSDFSTVVIVDGYFRSVPAVGHQEIKEALKTRSVLGCSSMGAIRACEMRDFGMEGHGRVYQRFCDDETFADDEVVLLHTPGPRYLPGSEPLVNIRFLLEELLSDQLLNRGQVDDAIEYMKSLYFGDRTLDVLEAALSRIAGKRLAQIAIERLPDSRVKTRDFRVLLKRLCADD